MMVAAYMRRKEFEAEMIALKMVEYLGKAMGGGGRKGRSGKLAQRRQVSASHFTHAAGVEA